MAKHAIQQPLIYQDDNSGILPKKLGVDATIKSLKKVIKKGDKVVGSRSALTDITNKSSIETSLRKNLPKGKIVKEKCLHDHNKCIEAQQKAKEPCFSHSVIPEEDSVSPSELELERAKIDPVSPRCYPEPLDMPISEFENWLVPSTQLISPPSAPSLCSSLPLSPISLKIELGVDATIKNSETAVEKDFEVLNDMTNQSAIHPGMSSKTNLPEKENNISEEGFLHDHNKCIEAQQKVNEPCLLDLLLPGHGNLTNFSEDSYTEFERAKTDPISPRCYPELIEMRLEDLLKNKKETEFDYWLMPSTRWVSSPSSPLSWDSLPSSPISWNIESNFVLKEDGFLLSFR